MEALKFFFVLSLFVLSFGNRCQAVSSRKFIIYSSIFTEVIDSSYNYISRAVPCIDRGWNNIAGATWIWNIYEPSEKEYVYFRSQFFLSSTPSAGILQVVVDDEVNIRINDLEFECGKVPFNVLKTCDITPLLKSGKNTAIFFAYNSGAGPAGLIYKIEIDFT